MDDIITNHEKNGYDILNIKTTEEKHGKGTARNNKTWRNKLV